MYYTEGKKKEVGQFLRVSTLRLLFQHARPIQAAFLLAFCFLFTSSFPQDKIGGKTTARSVKSASAFTTSNYYHCSGMLPAVLILESTHTQTQFLFHNPRQLVSHEGIKQVKKQQVIYPGSCCVMRPYQCFAYL